MGTFSLLLVICVAGGSGGIVFAIGQMADNGKEGGSYKAANGLPLSMYLFARGLVGVGGAIAILLVLIWVEKFHDSPDTKDLLFLICLSFVAGFMGYRLLPMVAARLERQIQDVVEKQTEEVRKEVGEAVQYSQASRAISAALADLQRSSVLPLAIDNDIKEMEEVRKESPLDRKLHIVLARMYFERKGDYEKALGVLADFIEKKKSAGQGADKDVADALFNRACYLARKSILVTGPESEQLKKHALEDLRESIRLSPENKIDARADVDFDALRADTQLDDQFRRLTEEPA